ncbi:hypothetical protein EDD11_006943 [Mortierella claussenii]|nr:hypothetical protein EDD11_006943 [Mortierella claussenii]
MSGSQYYQHYHQQQQQRQYDQYMSSSPPSSRPSPRSTPNSYSIPYLSQPSSPMSFQLPPSALSPTKEESLRSGSISYQSSNGYGTNSHPIQIPQQSPSSSASSYRTPRMSPGMNGGGNGLSGLPISSMPPLTLPDAFLEEQSDYAEYYSDVGIVSQQHHQQRQRHFQQQLQQMQYQNAMLSLSISPQHSYRQQQVTDYTSSQHMSLPSPLLSPTVTPLSGEFPSLSLAEEEEQ